jgi:hypothetical protein
MREGIVMHAALKGKEKDATMVYFYCMAVP